jgi:hypothetical protein
MFLQWCSDKSSLLSCDALLWLVTDEVLTQLSAYILQGQAAQKESSSAPAFSQLLTSRYGLASPKPEFLKL